MTAQELEFIYAADELYGAFCRSAIGSRQKAALEEFARAFNAWGDHPGKITESERHRP